MASKHTKTLDESDRSRTHLFATKSGAKKTYFSALAKMDLHYFPRQRQTEMEPTQMWCQLINSLAIKTVRLFQQPTEMKNENAETSVSVIIIKSTKKEQDIVN